MTNFKQISVDSSSPGFRPVCQFAEPFAFRASGLNVKTESGSLVSKSIGVRLDLEDLPSFTVVDRQYASWGVLFSNAIAICPSNPAYPPRSGMMVLLGAPHNGLLEATFLQPVQHVSSFITSSRCTVMRAFNSRNQLVAETESLAALDQAHKYDQLSNLTNVRLSLNAANICRITLQSFNGHLTVDDFCFCLS
jgi:hypothetical protein